MRINIEGVVGELTTLPGCSQVAVSHAVFVQRNERGKGKGTAANLSRRILAGELGYDLMICTVDAANSAEIAVLGKAGWHPLTSFVSSKTGHTVEVWACSTVKTEAI